VVQEAPDRHVVGLVEHGDLHRGQVGVAGLDVILSRPGQAMTMSTPSRSFWIWGRADPTKDGGRTRLVALASGAARRRSGLASSRVGARISARGFRSGRGVFDAASRDTTGSRNA
jgi:hypothetical protein